VDVETRRPVDLLEERSADALAGWLAARPSAEVMSLRLLYLILIRSAAG
jgi:hypothetical protein